MTSNRLKPGFCQHCRCECGDRLGAEIWPNRPELADKVVWVCPFCGASVGSHPDGTPMGTAADAALRNARSHVHQKLDPIWERAFELPDYASARAHTDQKERMKALAIIKRTARVRTYAMLSEHMGLSTDDTHVAMFDIEECRKAYRFLRDLTYPQVRDWWKSAEQLSKRESRQASKSEKARAGSGSAKASRSRASSRP